MYRVKINLKILTVSDSFRSCILIMEYIHPTLGIACEDSIGCEEFEDKVEFLRRMVKLVNDKSRMQSIIKSNILSKIESNNVSDETAELIKQLESTVIELDIELNN